MNTPEGMLTLPPEYEDNFERLLDEAAASTAGAPAAKRQPVRRRWQMPRYLADAGKRLGESRLVKLARDPVVRRELAGVGTSFLTTLVYLTPFGTSSLLLAGARGTAIMLHNRLLGGEYGAKIGLQQEAAKVALKTDELLNDATTSQADLDQALKEELKIATAEARLGQYRKIVEGNLPLTIVSMPETAPSPPAAPFKERLLKFFPALWQKVVQGAKNPAIRKAVGMAILQGGAVGAAYVVAPWSVPFVLGATTGINFASRTGHALGRTIPERYRALQDPDEEDFSGVTINGRVRRLLDKLVPKDLDRLDQPRQFLKERLGQLTDQDLNDLARTIDASGKYGQRLGTLFGVVLAELTVAGALKAEAAAYQEHTLTTAATSHPAGSPTASPSHQPSPSITPEPSLSPHPTPAASPTEHGPGALASSPSAGVSPAGGLASPAETPHMLALTPSAQPTPSPQHFPGASGTPGPSPSPHPTPSASPAEMTRAPQPLSPAAVPAAPTERQLNVPFTEDGKTYIRFDIHGNDQPEIFEIHGLAGHRYVEMHYLDHGDGIAYQLPQNETVRLYIDQRTPDGSFVGEKVTTNPNGSLSYEPVYAIDKDDWMRQVAGQSNWADHRSWGLVPRRGLIASLGGTTPSEQVPKIQVVPDHGTLVGQWHGHPVEFTGQKLTDQDLQALVTQANNDDPNFLQHLRDAGLDYQASSLTANGLILDPHALMPDGTLATDHIAHLLTAPQTLSELPSSVSSGLTETIKTLNAAAPEAHQRALEDILGTIKTKEMISFDKLLGLVKDKTPHIEFPSGDHIPDVLKSVPGIAKTKEDMAHLLEHFLKEQQTDAIRQTLASLKRTLERSSQRIAGFTINELDDNAYVRVVGTDGTILDKVILPKDQVDQALQAGAR